MKSKSSEQHYRNISNAEKLAKPYSFGSKSSVLILSCVFLFFFPVLIHSFKIFPIHVLTLLLYYFCFIGLTLFATSLYINKKAAVNVDIEKAQENKNILVLEEKQLKQNEQALKDKIDRYMHLKGVVEQINETLNIGDIATHLVNVAFELISNSQGTCLLYLLDKKDSKLSLFKSRKDEKKQTVKAKEGDALDIWVLRHGTALIVDDITKDFRFDSEKIHAIDHRPFGSVISAPLVSENKILGVLRLDQPKAHAFSQEDLRFLATVCEIGAVAIENGLLFEETEHLATHDSLTQLFTKAYFLDRLKEECRRSLRHHTKFAILMIDIDFFKNYNDTFGHTAGDIVLRKISQLIVESCAPYGATIARFGGEEFCLILNDMDKEKARLIAQKICDTIAATAIILRRQETHVTVSIGIAGFLADSDIDLDLVMKADKAMYEAKQKGRNQVCLA